jgi:hypothetical protein
VPNVSKNPGFSPNKAAGFPHVVSSYGAQRSATANKMLLFYVKSPYENRTVVENFPVPAFQAIDFAKGAIPLIFYQLFLLLQEFT